jgi:hypothetical protein
MPCASVRKKANGEASNGKLAEILKLFDAGYSAENIRERLKAGGTMQ